MNYKDIFMKEWIRQGGLITQVQAAKILGKTPTRIRQMINENKIKFAKFDEQTPLISLSDVIAIYEQEEEEEKAIYEAQHKEEIELQAAREELEEKEWLERQLPDEHQEIKTKTKKTANKR